VNLSQFNRILLQALILPVIALLCVSGILVWQILDAEQTVHRIQVADQNIATANKIAALIADEEAGVRAYQNTANEIFLQPYEEARPLLAPTMQRLRDGITSQQGDLTPVDALEQAHRRWTATIAIPMIAMVRTGGETRDPAINLRGKAYMETIRAIQKEIIEKQETERFGLSDQWQREVDHTFEAVIGSALVLGLLIGLFARSRLHLVSEAFQTTLEEQHRTQAALLATEKLAVAGRLAASIAHEIHNPLDAVGNILYLMRQDTPPEERAQLLDMAEGELSRVTQISRAMLGMYREARTPVDLNVAEVLESVLLLMEHPLAQAELTVALELDKRAVVNGFPVELRQVFTNLLTNAVDASSPGGEIGVRVQRAERDVIVAIRDEGAGIRVENRERLFQPFFTTKGELGTGLGLWVSQGIVQKHGGTITVSTSTEPERHGTTMTVSLPRAPGGSSSDTDLLERE
jgi:signal transduction histidine kinase